MTTYRIGGVVARLSALGGRNEVEVGDAGLAIRMGRMFSSLVPRASITAARATRTNLLDGIGVHGWRGRWVVNGRLGDAVELTLDPPARFRVLGVPIKARTLVVGVDDPAALVAELAV